MDIPSAVATSSEVAAFDLRAGDEVTAQESTAAYEVLTVEPLQGRVRVSDSTGVIHIYDQRDPLTVRRPG